MGKFILIKNGLLSGCSILDRYKIDTLKIGKFIYKMNTLEYYNRQKDSWDKKELHDIQTEYEVKKMTISEIADIHHRTPGCISFKLKNLGLISNNKDSRGYLDYKNSKLYKEIVKTSKENDAEKKGKKDAFNEISQMRNEIAELKKDVKQMLRLMNALYDFESQ